MGLDKCTCKAPQTGNRDTDAQSPTFGEKICTYHCKCETECGEKYQKTIEVSVGTGGSATCKGQWDNPWHPNPNFQTGFDSFTVHTEGYSPPALWDGMFNGDIVDALNAGGAETP